MTNQTPFTSSSSEISKIAFDGGELKLNFASNVFLPFIKQTGEIDRIHVGFCLQSRVSVACYRVREDTPLFSFDYCTTGFNSYMD